MLALVVTLALGLLPAQEPQEKKPVPKDSIELTVIGCLQGRILSTVDKRGTDVESSPYVGERTFRLNGNKDVTNEIKKRQKQLVEVVGLVKRSALDDKGSEVGARLDFRRVAGRRHGRTADGRGQRAGDGRIGDPYAVDVVLAVGDARLSRPVYLPSRACQSVTTVRRGGCGFWRGLRTARNFLPSGVTSKECNRPSRRSMVNNSRGRAAWSCGTN